MEITVTCRPPISYPETLTGQETPRIRARDIYAKTIGSTRHNIVSNQEWYRTKSSVEKHVAGECLSHNPQTFNTLQRSVSADNVVIRSRGFKPSDRHDPAKRHFLENLTSKILHFDMDSGEATPVNLQKLLTPAMDTTEILQTRNKKMYASSCFYAPTHPTVEDQVELARRISYSLSDVKNMKSKGQSMYVNRKKRSVKWIHDGNGDEGDEEPVSPIYKDKVPLKCMMNPNGKVLDIHGIQALGEEVNVGTSPMNAEKLFDIVRDLNNKKGRGAEIFAKRRKRSEKWIVDKEQTPTTPGNITKSSNFSSKLDVSSNENSKFTSAPSLTTLPTPAPNFDNKPFYNPLTMDLSLGTRTPQKIGDDHKRSYHVSENGNDNKYVEVKKIYLREVAVGTEPDYLIGNDNERAVSVEKSKRIMSFNPASTNNDHYNASRRKLSLTSNGGVNICSNNCPNKEISNIRGNNNIQRQISDRHHHAHSHHHHHHHHQQYQYRMQSQQMADVMPDNSEYTPVPVKQLIQEFEKTCRPTLQYKQISPKIIPIVQQCPPLDNDISRFFESSQHQQVHRPSTNGHELSSKKNTNTVIRMANGNSKDLNYEGNGYGAKSGYGGQPIQRLIGQTIRYEEYDSTEDEIDDSFDDSGSEVDYRQAYHADIYDDESQSCANTNGTRATSNATMDEYEMYVRQFDESTERFEAPPGFRNDDIDDCGGNDENHNKDPKSMVLAMVATQEEILDTMKHLRSTPVLENLVGAPSPNFYADVGNSKLCESTYQGPKIASYQTLTNYNTAPRGWDQTQTFYRPVTFGKQQEPIAYSDF